MKFPINEQEKEWLDQNMIWLLHEFGLDYFKSRTMILPSQTFFPEPYFPDKHGMRHLFDKVCQYMDIDSSKIVLTLFTEKELDLGPKLKPEEWREESAGLFFRQTSHNYYEISIEQKQLQNPETLIAILAHELSHYILIVDKQMPKNDEYLIDLTTVFMGFGVFMANSILQTKYWQEGGYFGWNIIRLGYMSHEMFGYALALFSFLKEDYKPEWIKILQADVKSYFKKSMKCLLKIENEKFDLNQIFNHKITNVSSENLRKITYQSKSSIIG